MFAGDAARSSHVELVSDISRLLKPAAYLQRLAEKVIAGFPEGSSAAFNGLHLRMEEDSQYIEMLGGVEVSAVTLQGPCPVRLVARVPPP